MSQCDRVLVVLADGLPHDIQEIHDRAGTMRLNSRVAELRTRGHEIVCTRDRDTYAYQLVSSLGEPEIPGAPGPGSPSEAEIVLDPPPGEPLVSLDPVQLSFEVVA